MPARSPSRARKAKVRTARKSLFTLRDLSRQTADVIQAADALGAVQIKSRDGRKYLLTATQAPGKSSIAPADWRARRDLICPAELSTKFSAGFDKVLAGE